MDTKQKLEHDKLVENAILDRIDELKKIDIDDRYDDMLNECYSFETVGGIFAGMQPASVLERCDPVAYRCGLNDWVDGELGETLREFDDDYYDLEEFDDLKQECEALIDEREAAEEQERAECQREDLEDDK